MDEKLLILRESTTDEDFYSFTAKHGLQFADQATPEEGYVFQLTYQIPGQEAFVRFLHEPVVDLPCLVLFGKAIPALENAVRQEFDVVEVDEIMSMYADAHTTKEKRKALAYVALAASQGYEEWIGSVITSALSDADCEVRKDAIYVMRYAAAEETIGIARDVAEGDEDPSVRKEAKSFLRAIRE